MTRCPRCGADVAAGQEYCLECGLRLPGASRLGPLPTTPRSLALPLARRGARRGRRRGGARSVLTRDTATATTIVTATGGSELARVPTVTTSTAPDWPQARAGGRTSSSRFRRSTAGTPRSPAPNRRGARDCDRSACSIRRATRASIRVTGWSSQGSTRASPRRRAACARRRRAGGSRTQPVQPLNLLSRKAISGQSL